MREQRQESEWILSCQRSLRLKLGCAKDLCRHFLFALVVDVVMKFARDGALNELLSGLPDCNVQPLAKLCGCLKCFFVIVHS